MPDIQSMISPLDESAADIQTYLDYLKGRPKPAMPPSVTQQAEPTMNDQIKNRFLENSELLRRLRGDKVLPSSQGPELPPPRAGGSFQPSQWVNDFMKNYRPTPGSFQPSQWSKLPPAPTTPQPGTSIIPIPNADVTPPRGALIPNAEATPPAPTRVGGMGGGMLRGIGVPTGLGGFLAPIASIASQKDTVSPEKYAAMVNWMKNRQASLPNNTTSIPKDQSRYSNPPEWPGMIPSPEAASSRSAPIGWNGPVPLPRTPPPVPLPRPRAGPPVPLPRPRIAVPVPMPVKAPIRAAQTRPAQPPSGLDQLLRALMGNPVVYDHNAVNTAWR